MSPKSKVPYSKPPISYTEQVAQLISRGLEISDEARAKFYLSQLNYYRFAAYCLPYEKDHESHQFIESTKFEDILNLYIFDRELRLLLLDAIERFEVSLRTQMAYCLSHRYDSAHPHLAPEIFFNPVIYGISISKHANDVRNSREDFIKHLSRKYEEQLPPIWASVELMTMGQLSKWFSNIEARGDRQAISRNYKVDEKILSSFCNHLTTIRNHCAHHARLWNRDFTVTMKLPIKGDSNLISGIYNLDDNDRRRRKIYNALVMLAHLMDVISEAHHWKIRLKSLIDSHQIDVSKMGFPNDWEDRDIWK